MSNFYFTPGQRLGADILAQIFGEQLLTHHETLLLGSCFRSNLQYMEKMARCFASLGRKTDAQRTYGEILDLDPTNASALREVGELRQVETLKKQAVAAVGDYRQFPLVSPNHTLLFVHAF
jgi:hypothetical protein